MRHRWSRCIQAGSAAAPDQPLAYCAGRAFIGTTQEAFPLLMQQTQPLLLLLPQMQNMQHGW